MSKIPAFQFYPGDWRKSIDVQSLGYFERGVWFEMLCLMHESEQRGKLIIRGKKMTNDTLSRLLGLDKQSFERCLSTLIDAGVASLDKDTGAVISRRMVRDEQLRIIRTSAGKKGGNPALLNQNGNGQPKGCLTKKDNQTGEDEDANENAIEITPEMVASAVIQELRISGRNLRIVLEEIARNDMACGKTADQVRDGMISAYHEFQKAKPSLQFVKGLEKFYGEGDWRDSKTWPWKEKKSPDAKTAAEWEEFENGGKK